MNLYEAKREMRDHGYILEVKIDKRKTRGYNYVIVRKGTDMFDHRKYKTKEEAQAAFNTIMFKDDYEIIDLNESSLINETKINEETFDLSRQAKVTFEWHKEINDVELIMDICQKNGSEFRVSNHSTFINRNCSYNQLCQKIIGLFRKIVGISLFNTNDKEIIDDNNSISKFADIENQIENALSSDEFEEFYNTVFKEF